MTHERKAGRCIVVDCVAIELNDEGVGVVANKAS